MKQVKYLWVAVRCCCTPTKVLGFMRLSEDALRLPKFWVQSRDGREEIELRMMEDSHKDFRGEVTWDREIAVYAEERPIGFWRQIPGFIEVHHPAFNPDGLSDVDILGQMKSAMFYFGGSES
jgi:hypothetical protein